MSERGCTWTQWLAEREFDLVSIGIANAAVVPHRIRLIDWLPHQSAFPTGPICDLVDSAPALHGKSKVREVARDLVPMLAARDQDDDERVPAPGLREPYDVLRVPRYPTAVDHVHATVGAIEVHAGIECIDVQSDMRERGGHMGSLART